MSILDGLPNNAEDIEVATRAATQALADWLDDFDGPPAAKKAIELIKKGVPMSAWVGLTDAECDALFTQACSDLQAGAFERARNLLVIMHMLYPLHGRYVYALAMTYQLSGDPAAAGKLYIQFLARDATNPDGYLRLGECFLANAEYDAAIETFEMALDHVGNGPAPDAARRHAQQMIEAARKMRGDATS